MNQNHWSDELSTFHKKRQKKVQRLGLCKKVEPNFSKKNKNKSGWDSKHWSKMFVYRKDKVTTESSICKKEKVNT